MSVSQMQADCGTGMGVSYIFFENNGSTTPYWYNCSGTGNHALSDGLGEVYSIKIGAQVQTWGQSKATDNPAQIWYKFDSNSFAWLVNLCYWKYESNNNWFQSGCSTADADQTLDISSLTPGNHTLSVYFKIKDCDKYDSNGGSNYSITFIKMPKVTFNANGGSVSTSEQYVSYNSSTALSSITTLGLNPPTGYHFDHWTDGGNTYSDGESVTLTTNITLTAIYEPNVYDITYLDCNSTSFSGTHDTGYPTTHTYNTSTTLYDATKIGYTFGGWYADSDCSGDEITSLGATAYTSNITLYAKWVATITLDENGGSTPGSATTLFNSDADLDISAPSHATGYYILGYYEDVECTTTLVADADGKLESDVSGFTSGGKWVATENKTLYTKWSNQYTITFEQGTPTIQGTDNTIATYGSAMPAVTVPSKTGYIFGGYWTGENGTGTKYYNANGTSANNWTEDENVNSTLYAQWTGIRYQVAFDANEGTGSMDNQDFTYGPDDDATNENLSQNNDYITREGYYFLGWNTRADGTGTKFYDQKPVRNLTTVDGGIVTLYAQWAKTYTLYFLNIKTDGWQNVSGNQESTNRYAYAFIYYDEHKLEPLGSYSAGTSQGTRMTTSSSIYLPNVGTSPTAWCWSIADVPEGATIIFSDNTDGNKTGDLSGWTPSKPYYCKGNNTWYTTDGENTISQMTNMSVHIGAGDFASWKYVGIDKHEDGSDYAIIWLNRDKTYEFKFSNWYQGGESGSVNGYSIIDGGSTKADYGGEPRTLESTYNVKVNTNTHASGQYKFVLTGWSGDKPQTRVYVPRGVNLTTTSPTSATAGETVTVSFTADAWTNLEYGTDMDNPTYYFEFSKDNSNWSTIATYSAPSAKHATASYTFEAQSGYFRVKLVNDHGLASYSGSTEFTAYSTKSFYVYNPYNTSGNWSYLHLYTWDSNNGNARYNGDFPTGSEENDCGYVHGVDNAEPINCKNGNNIEYMGQNWFYITIDERANCFMLVGEATYKDHQTVTCYVNNYIPDAKYMIYTYENANYVKEYNAKSTSDYRLKYTYVVDEETKERYSPIYNTLLDNTLVEKTTVITSMWMDPRDASAKLIVEQGASDGSWSTVTTFDNNGSDDFDGLLTSAKRTKGDVFRMDLQFNPGPPASATISNVAVNNGPFYVRTDALDGGWNVYKKADHMLYVNENTSADYNYYLCKWIGTSGTNVKFTIADDYNTELVESYGKEPNASDPLYNRETLPATANVRFSWNSEENTLSRAYLSGSTNASDRFLVLVETTSPSKGLIYDSEGRTITEAGGGKVSGLGDYELIFKDNGNWVYQVVIQANPNAEAKVTADYNSQVQEFIASRQLLGGTGGTKYRYRFVYDFKTNNLVSAFEPAGADPTIAVSLAIHADLMLIREHQESANQITFASSQSLSEVKKVFGVMQFNKWTLNDLSKTGSHISLSPSLSRYERDLFWISFPFEVKLKDVFGFGEYGTHWIIERYDGKTRAQKGFWADSEPNWKFITPYQRDSGWVLNANEGYILALDLDELGLSSPIWDNSVEDVYLYFPSSGNIESIADVTSQEVRINQDGYQCMIGPRFEGGDDRRIKDSYWHCIGVPSYKNTSYNVTTSAPNLGDRDYWAPEGMLYYYKWTPDNNSLSIESTTSSQPFNTMHAYMVQYSGETLTWSNVTNVPSSVAARLAETPDREYQLVLIRENEEQDHTYVRLTDDANVSNRFEFNYDLSKEYNAGRGNIWTVTADTVEVAGNSMPKPVQTTVVPVGVKVVANGEYTFSMPEGTNGEDVYLIDNAYGTRTNLGLMPYTVTLTAGTYEGRFALEFAPIQDSPTSLENDGLSRSDELNDANDDVRKVFVGGRLYIIRDGKVYDAAGQRIE